MNDNPDDLAWARLAKALDARREGTWLHVEIARRPFALTRMVLGASTLVVAHSVVAVERELDATDAAGVAAGWPVGSLVLHDGRWISRHAFVGVPTPAEAADVLRGLAYQLQPLEPRLDGRASQHAVAANAHYAD